jgi:uncharacterized protein YceH (UPF0502 family)
MTPDIRLDPHEARVFGVLVEKALTTPDQYPLSVNAATNGANQKSNRDPVLSLSEDQVAAALYRLEQKYMARKVFPGNSRVEKYCHNGKEALGLDAVALAVIAELLMRGPQTAGELRARASRMTAFESLEALATVLDQLIERELARRLDPAPGSRAERYVQLLSPDAPTPPSYQAMASGAAAPPASGDPTLTARVEALEAEVARLRAEVDRLAQR